MTPLGEIDRRKAALTPKGREALERRLRAAGGASSSGLPRASRVEPIPLSFAQERIWLHQQLVPGSVVYNRPANVRLRGPLRIEPLRQALRGVVARHESLSTIVSRIGSTPTLRAHALGDLEVPFTDLSDKPSPERSAWKLATEDAARPFDLERGPLLRCFLLRIDDEDHLLLLTFHHFTFDAWSLVVLLEELTRDYEALVRGVNPSVEVPAIQCPDFAAWERSPARSPAIEKGRSYWRREMASPPVLQLPTDFPRSSPPSEEAGQVDFGLPGELVSGLRNLARSEQATFFSVLLAAFTTLLYRLTGDGDIVVGCPVAGRNLVETEKLIGVFINVLPIRVSLAPGDTFRQLSRRVRDSVVRGLHHQDTPLQWIARDAPTDRNLGGSPLFQAMFIHERFSSASRASAGLVFEPTDSEPAATMIDLSLHLTESAAGVGGRLVYRARLWEKASIERLASYFLTLLKGVVADADQRISAIPLLTETERRELLADYRRRLPTQPYREFPHDEIEQSIPSRFERQVRRAPDRMAVRTANHRWTYEQLNQSANRVAHALIAAQGTDPERVALLLDHDAPMIAATMGVLKAGKAYVPLDSSHPRTRLESILADADARVLVTNDSGRGLTEALVGKGRRIINIDAIETETSNENPGLEISPDSLAYLLYTSGSTGVPKGVAQNHRNVLHFMSVYTNNLRLGDEDRLTLFASYGFDAAVMDIFGALLNGATLYPLDVKNCPPNALLDVARTEAITVFHSTPTVYRYLLDLKPPPEGLPSVRLVVLGGERVERRDVELFQRHFSRDCILVNGLGPTESTLALQYFLPRNAPPTGASVPVGYPVDGMEVSLLDDQGLENDTRGEIAIRSRHVALGYWNQPDLTRERFLPDPDGGDRRTYRTGDLARRRPDGALDFLGRIDDQVKLRGVRVELGEIESVLEEHPSVARGVVVLREDRPGDKRLVGYLIPAVGDPWNATDLTRHLRDRLPSHMVPSAFVPLRELPMTPSGKLDRKALPAPDVVALRGAGEGHVAPRDDLERQLVAVWEEVFQARPIGVRDDFFELGGYSLLAVHLFARMERAVGRSLPLATLLQRPTIEGLAEVLRQAEIPEARSGLVPIQAGGDSPPLFLVPGVGRRGLAIGLEMFALARAVGPGLTIYSFDLPNLLDEFPPNRLIVEVAERFVKEIRAVQPSGPYHLIGHSLGGLIAFEMARLLGAIGEPVGLLGVLDTSAPGFRSYLTWSGRLRVHATKLRSLSIRPGLVYIRSVIRSHFRNKVSKKPARRASEAYRERTQPLYQGRITLFRATLTARSRPRTTAEATLGWDSVAQDGVEVHEIQGDHVSILREPGFSELAKALRAFFERTQETNRPAPAR